MSNQVIKNKRNQDASVNTSNASSNSVGDEFGRSIKNLSIIAKLAKSKKSKMTKTNFKTDFLTLKAKKPLFTYEKHLPKHQFFSILICNIIFVLKPILQDILLVKF